MVLTRPPRKRPEGHPVRLACIRHAASVDPEPGSNSPPLCRSCSGSVRARSPMPVSSHRDAPFRAPPWRLICLSVRLGFPRDGPASSSTPEVPTRVSPRRQLPVPPSSRFPSHPPRGVAMPHVAVGRIRQFFTGRMTSLLDSPGPVKPRPRSLPISSAAVPGPLRPPQLGSRPHGRSPPRHQQPDPVSRVPLPRALPPLSRRLTQCTLPLTSVQGLLMFFVFFVALLPASCTIPRPGGSRFFPFLHYREQ